uniref:Neurotransmitter-gated ion-channel transmembrane domain-containing protein n=1 Tax=Glossina pallidipes TaxID=7398 RepID=A0A1A9ZZ59_GLOPL
MDEQQGSNIVDVGVDLSEFYMSVEWDILEVPAVRNEKFYTCCDEPYLDITFNITMRRKTLFYTVNIIIPCMGISFLTVLTFYLPSDSGEKVTLSISILISLHVFFLLVVEIIPPTSLVVPLLGNLSGTGPFGGSCQIHGPIPPLTQSESDELTVVPDIDAGLSGIKSPILSNPVKEDWKYVAMVLDRLFLWIFTLAVLAGTAGIILQAPTLYDDRIPIIEQKDIDFSGTSAGRCRPPQ